MAALPQDSYLDFVYAPAHGYMASLWRGDRWLGKEVRDELWHRDRIRMQIFTHYTNTGDTVRGAGYIETTNVMPNDVILAFNGEELLTVGSRREAVELYTTYELAEAKRELAEHEWAVNAVRPPKKRSLFEKVNRWLRLD